MKQYIEQENSSRSNSVPISKDTILLLALGTAHLYLSPVNSGIIVIMMALYVIVDVICPEMPDEVRHPTRKHSTTFLAKLTILFSAILVATLVPTAWSVMFRNANGPETYAHDGVVQVETAVEYLLDGKNPYVEDYLGTPLEHWKPNPVDEPFEGPLYHFVYLPFLLYLTVPFYLLSHFTLGWYDQRFLYTTLYMGVMLLVPLLVARQRDRLMLLMLIGLNVLFAYFLADGRNDVVILFGLLLVTVLLSRAHLGWATFVLGLTLAVKHQAWFFLPFFVLYTMPRPLAKESIKRWLIRLWPMYLALGATILPFLLWAPEAFLDDTIGYILGRGDHSFPIFGIGLSRIMVAIGILPSRDASFPFIWLSLAFCLPVLFFVARRQWRDNSLSNLWFGFAAFSFAFQFPSRFFNNNYVIFCLQALFIAIYVRDQIQDNHEMLDAPQTG